MSVWLAWSCVCVYVCVSSRVGPIHACHCYQTNALPFSVQYTLANYKFAQWVEPENMELQMVCCVVSLVVANASIAVIGWRLACDASTQAAPC